MDILYQDLKKEILLHVPYPKILTLSQVCKEFHHIVQDNAFWQTKLERDFPQHRKAGLSWRDQYYIWHRHLLERQLGDDIVTFFKQKKQRERQIAKHKAIKIEESTLNAIYRHKYWSIIIDDEIIVTFSEEIQKLYEHRGQSLPTVSEVEFIMKNYNLLCQAETLEPLDIIVIYRINKSTMCRFYVNKSMKVHMNMDWSRWHNFHQVMNHTWFIDDPDIALYHIPEEDLTK